MRSIRPVPSARSNPFMCSICYPLNPHRPRLREKRDNLVRLLERSLVREREPRQLELVERQACQAQPGLVEGDPVSRRYVAVLLRITKQPNVSWIRSMVREPTLQGTGRRFWSPTPIPFSPTPLPGRATHAGTAFSRAMP